VFGFCIGWGGPAGRRGHCHLQFGEEIRRLYYYRWMNSPQYLMTRARSSTEGAGAACFDASSVGGHTLSLSHSSSTPQLLQRNYWHLAARSFGSSVNFFCTFVVLVFLSPTAPWSHLRPLLLYMSRMTMTAYTYPWWKFTHTVHVIRVDSMHHSYISKKKTAVINIMIVWFH